MAEARQARPESKGFVIEAAKKAFLQGMTEATVKDLIQKYVPESVRDSEKKNYSKFVLHVVKNDDKFQQKLQEKSNTFAR